MANTKLFVGVLHDSEVEVLRVRIAFAYTEAQARAEFEQRNGKVLRIFEPEAVMKPEEHLAIDLLRAQCAMPDNQFKVVIGRLITDVLHECADEFHRRNGK